MTRSRKSSSRKWTPAAEHRDAARSACAARLHRRRGSLLRVWMPRAAQARRLVPRLLQRPVPIPCGRDAEVLVRRGIPCARCSSCGVFIAARKCRDLIGALRQGKGAVLPMMLVIARQAACATAAGSVPREVGGCTAADHRWHARISSSRIDCTRRAALPGPGGGRPVRVPRTRMRPPLR